LLRAYKTYATGSVHQNSVTAIVPQHNGISSGEAWQSNNFFVILIQIVNGLPCPAFASEAGP
jgi:hypothetical protein